jgi:hypothetical protein
MIIALAGRRIDAADSKHPRFPLANVERVSKSVHDFLAKQKATAIVSSAACGADLIGLMAAGRLGLRRRIVLPFDRARFRQTSVVDRPGEWGTVYDKVLDEVDAAGDLLILDSAGGADPYSLTSRFMLDEAVRLARKLDSAAEAVMIWDGESREKQDYTAEFGSDARRRNLPVFEIVTM